MGQARAISGPISGMVAADLRPLGPAPATGGWSAPGVRLAGPVPFNEDALTVVADARLDNRTELASALGLPARAEATAVIAAAYRCWGEDCPARLDGAFAFALWDARARRLLCARDVAGVRPLHYRAAGGALAFAQSAQALAGPAPAPRAAAIADFLYGRVLDAESTWFDGVMRLPAGHSLLFEGGRCRITRHSRLAPALHDPARPAPEILRELLDAAVAARAE
ncbi:MAG: hypothetical protein NBV68_18545, partial [Erythrobacter sp.]|nr:hypothetical protein [Erythrobacter sp.]